MKLLQLSSPLNQQIRMVTMVYLPKFWKRVSLSFISTYIYICNLSLRKGIFPSHLKYSQAIPLKKTKGQESKISNFRPISLLLSFYQDIKKNDL